MTTRGTTGAIAAPNTAFGMLPMLGALAALCVYGFLVAFPSAERPPVPWAAPCAAAAFALLQALLPACRPSREQLLSPRNWALVAFFVQLVALPLSICIGGFEYGALSWLPSARAIDQSLCISIAAFAAFSTGCSLALRRAPSSPSDKGAFPRPFIALYAAAGVLGLLLAFRSFGAISAALTDPAQFKDLSSMNEGTLAGAASTFLRPFLLNAIILFWCHWLDSHPGAATSLKRAGMTAAAVLGVMVVGATYGFNRAAFMVPLAAMAAAYSAQVHRISVPALTLAGLLFGGLGLLLGGYRSGTVTAGELTDGATRDEMMFSSSPQAQLQIYGNAPQFAAFLLDAVELMDARFTPRTLLGSLMTPVPILGKGIRDESGVKLYNYLLYGDDETVDQIIPFEAEVYLCLGGGGLLAAFLLLGLTIGQLQRAFDSATRAFDRYVPQFVAIWLAFLVQGSLAALSQIVVFFLWPIYGYLLLRRQRSEAAPAELPAA